MIINSINAGTPSFGMAYKGFHLPDGRTLTSNDIILPEARARISEAFQIAKDALKDTKYVDVSSRLEGDINSEFNVTHHVKINLGTESESIEFNKCRDAIFAALRLDEAIDLMFSFEEIIKSICKSR